MSIKINLDLVLLKKGISSKDLARTINITSANLSILKTGKARAIRLSTLNDICKALDCQPGDILEYIDDGLDDNIENDID
ncbi:helix-turn-helix transcriptional regulator [Peptostreptococcus stomatis]|uniref:helix-turn-helix domain-containing protein n=1 Tax=Peptostreptococcus stomatis TaxID=341694 RepID=UPI0028DC8723|nr:helix-turn-helix transcriptional regulator [Peptostreptococcus stomatis]